MSRLSNRPHEPWPSLPYEAWKDTCATLHRWTQIVGKVRVAQTPWVNHSWHSALYVSARGLTTSPIPYGRRVFEIEFDFVDHSLVIRCNEGSERRTPLVPRSVADFYAMVMGTLEEMGLEIDIHGAPNEIPDGLPFTEDHEHKSYDPDAAHRFWQALVQIDRVFKEFRTGFLGKVSPVHFFWGSFDMAVTRFSGRRAPRHPGGVPALPDAVACEAYSHEVSSAGFWPGSAGLEYPAFYSYAYPAAEDFAKAKVEPKEAFYHEGLKEFILPYEAVRQAREPEAMLLAFLQSTYDAAAETGGWDRAELECGQGVPRVPREV